MSGFILIRDDVIKQTVQNMIEARVVKPDEREMFANHLQQLDPRDLLAVLLESHCFREQFKDLPAPNQTATFAYQIDVDAISKN